MKRTADWPWSSFHRYFGGSLAANSRVIKERVAAVLEGIPGDPFVLANLLDVIEGGLKELQQNGDDPDQVIQRADRALYVAKTTGRDRYCIEHRSNIDEIQGEWWVILEMCRQCLILLRHSALAACSLVNLLRNLINHLRSGVLAFFLKEKLL